MKKKCLGYVTQDQKRLQRALTPAELDKKTYVKHEWVESERMRTGGLCSMCHEFMDEEIGSRNQLTVDRMDSDGIHSIANCCLMCLRCNNCKGDRKI